MLSLQPTHMMTSELLRSVHMSADKVSEATVTDLRLRLEEVADIVTSRTDPDTKIIQLRRLMA